MAYQNHKDNEIQVASWQKSWNRQIGLMMGKYWTTEVKEDSEMFVWSLK